MKKTFDICEGECYRIMNLYGKYTLFFGSDNKDSIERCRAMIDMRNGLALFENFKEIVRPEQFLIVKCIWNRIFYPDGTLLEYNEKIRTVEIYPAEI